MNICFPFPPKGMQGIEKELIRDLHMTTKHEIKRLTLLAIKNKY